MRLNRYNFVFVLGLVLTIGLSTAMAGGKDKGAKIPKGMAALRVTTKDISENPTNATYPIKIDGKYLGQSGADTFAEYFIEPGFHTVEVTGPDGKTFTREIEFRRGVRECICLDVFRNTTTKDCPYRMAIDRSSDIFEDDQTVTFTARNLGTAMPLIYRWRVTDGVITDGDGTESITVRRSDYDVTSINVELDVNDDKYDGRCIQNLSIPTPVKPRETPKPTAYTCDAFEYNTEDYVKAVSDNCMAQVQQKPGSKLIIDIFPGTDRRSMVRNTFERLKQRNRDYLRKRGLDDSLVEFRKGSSRPTTRYVVWVVPSGAPDPELQ